MRPLVLCLVCSNAHRLEALAQCVDFETARLTMQYNCITVYAPPQSERIGVK